MIAFEYFYQSGEQKHRAEVIFGNRQNLSLKTIHLGLYVGLPGNYFIASQVRVPEVFFPEVFPGDLCWHEYWAIRPTRQPADDPYQRDISQFVMEVQAAFKAGWEAFERSPSMEEQDGKNLYQAELV